MKILIIGSGGREHVLAWKIKQSPLVKKIYCAPGNGGIERIAECVPIHPTDVVALKDFAKKKGVDLTVVGPEAPLVGGIVDLFEAEGLKIFGPSGRAAQLEGSKVFAKEFMHKCNIPTAIFKSFDDPAEALEFVKNTLFPVVVKAEGLAAGKGVIICQNEAEATKAIDEIMRQNVFKEAGQRVVIEEFLEGEEASILAISDGEHYKIFESSQDHKRIFDDDLGPNTGGMGAYSPAPVVTEDIMKTIESRVIEPTIRGMNREGIPFKGVLYAGIMITKDGPKVLEYNARFGDPEAQVVLPRLKTDLVPVMLACCEGRLEEMDLHWDQRSAICVVMSSGGYPGTYETGYPIEGLEEIEKETNAVVFHAGTKNKDGVIVTDGGRVLGVTHMGDGIIDAIDKVYHAIEKVRFNRCFFRRDIGAKALAFLKTKTTSRR